MQIKTPISIEYRGCSAEEPVVPQLLGELAYVPLFLQKMLAREGCQVVFCKGEITNNPELQHCSGEHYGRAWHDLSGAYEDKKTFIRTDSTYPVRLYPKKKRSLIIHEIAHGIDELVGMALDIGGVNSEGALRNHLSDHGYWNKIFEGKHDYDSKADRVQDEIRSEYFAKMMELYFLSIRPPEKLNFWFSHPSVWLFFRMVMTKAQRYEREN